MKNYLYSNTVGVLAIIFTSILSPQACAQEKSASELGKQIRVDRATDIETSDELSEEELALIVDDSNINIAFSDKVLQVEFADSFEERALGLMHRKSLCNDCGMLFQFDSERIASIWMKNTFVPLDLAYITIDGSIVDIKQLQPHDLNSVISSQEVLFALEMNQGWFAKNGIKVGDKISIEGRVKQPSF